MKNWETVKLGDLCEVLTKGTTPTSIGFKFLNSGINFIKVESLSETGNIIPNKVAYIGEDCNKAMNRSQLQKNDILFSIAGALGRIGIVKEEILPANTNQALAIIRLKRDSNILVNFLTKYFNSNNISDEIDKLRIGAAQQNLSLTQLRNLSIPLPPLPEQQRIVSILDECFAAIDQAKANAEQNLKNARELFESYLQGVFEKRGEGWELSRMGDICRINDGTHFSPKNGNDGAYMYVTAKNIKPYYLDLSNITYVSEVDHKEIYARCAPVKGDVLYIKDGATAGIAAINSIEAEFSLLSSVALIKCSDKILNTFLVHYMNSTVGKKNFLGYIDGAAITRLTLVKIKNVCFPLPPLNEQQNIVHKLDTLRSETQKLVTVYQQKIASLEELKKSILKKAFAGELSTVN